MDRDARPRLGSCTAAATPLGPVRAQVTQACVARCGGVGQAPCGRTSCYAATDTPLPRFSAPGLFWTFCPAEFLGNQLVTPGIRSKVAQVLRPPDAVKLRAELKTIADLLVDRQLVQERLVGSVGEKVRVVGGPLAGYEGTVIRTKANKWKLVVEISFLGARREFELDERTVERA